MKRSMARDGFQVVQSDFHHNPITNKRTGDGFVQIRTQNDRKFEVGQNSLGRMGLGLIPAPKRAGIETLTRRRVGD